MSKPLARGFFYAILGQVVNRVSMTDNNRPEVLLSAADHWEDIKIRWQIHQYEMNHLMQDLSLVLNALTDRAFYTMTDRISCTGGIDILPFFV